MVIRYNIIIVRVCFFGCYFFIRFEGCVIRVVSEEKFRVGCFFSDVRRGMSIWALCRGIFILVVVRLRV